MIFDKKKIKIQNKIISLKNSKKIRQKIQTIFRIISNIIPKKNILKQVKIEMSQIFPKKL
jgi:hypothetical protein